MATVSMPVVNWTNKANKSMPVKYTLKSEDPANGLSAEKVAKAVQYGSDSYPNVKFPADAFAAVFRDTDNGNKIGGLLYANKTAYQVKTNTKDEEPGLFSVVDQIGHTLEVIA